MAATEPGPHARAKHARGNPITGHQAPAGGYETADPSRTGSWEQYDPFESYEPYRGDRPQDPYGSYDYAAPPGPPPGPPPAPHTAPHTAPTAAPRTDEPAAMREPGRRAQHNTRKGAQKGAPSGRGGEKPNIATEITASFVVFLVALPLCIGVAVASSAPPELGIISGVIGGLVVGMARGSTLQVSGPAAGLAALVAEAVLEHGLATLGVIVLVTGVLQIGLGLIRLGRMFQATSIAVVQGMLAGIGLPLMFSQSYPMADNKAPGTAIENMLGIPQLIVATVANPQAMIAAGLGIATIVLSFMWKKAPGPVKKIPAALVAVGIGIAVAAMPGIDVKTLQVGNLLGSVQLPGPAQFAQLASGSVWATILTFTIIASAESLFTAAAVDRMHSGAKTKYNSELVAQGVGNTVAGVLGALPITAVVARSSANVQAGAKTRLSRTLHGLWLLAFAILLPGVLALIPISVLAGVLVHSGWKLFAPEQFPKMWKQDRGEFFVMTLTTLSIVATALLEGVLIGLAAGIVLAALRMSQTAVRTSVEGDTAKLVMNGNATFLRLPKLIDALEEVGAAGTPRIRLDLTAVTHMDHACRSQIDEFVTQHRSSGQVRVELLMPTPPKEAAVPQPAPEEAYLPTGPGPTAEWFYLDPEPYREDPYGRDPHGRDPHGQDPHGQDPHGRDPHREEEWAPPRMR